MLGRLRNIAKLSPYDDFAFIQEGYPLVCFIGKYHFLTCDEHGHSLSRIVFTIATARCFVDAGIA